MFPDDSPKPATFSEATGGAVTDTMERFSVETGLIPSKLEVHIDAARNKITVEVIEPLWMM